MGEFLLKAKDIGRRAPESDRWLLQNISIELHAGERVALLGPSGSGKSLLLRALALLDALDCGTLEWCGQLAGQQHGSPEYRRNVIYVHQRPALFEGTVEHNFRQPFSLKVHKGRQYDRDRVLTLLREVGRDHSFLDKGNTELSGGEGQITCLVRAIQLDPSVLLLDEPTAALDEEATKAIESLVSGWLDQAKDKRALILVSHDAEQAERISGRTIRIRDGRIESDGRQK